MHARTLLAAAATAGLLAGAAVAQDVHVQHPALPPQVAPGVDVTQVNPEVGAQQEASQARTAGASDVAATLAPVPQELTTGWPYLVGQVPVVPTQPPLLETVTNGPVPDTAATRNLYPPLSRAGRATAAAGN